MSKVCHECGQGVTNPYYAMSLIICDEEGTPKVVSNLDVALCYRDFKKIPDEVKIHKTEMCKNRVFVGITCVLCETGFMEIVPIASLGQHFQGFEAIVDIKDILDVLPSSKSLIEMVCDSDTWIEIKDGEFGHICVPRPFFEKSIQELIAV